MTITLLISDADNESVFLRRVIQEALRVYREAHPKHDQRIDESRQSLAA